MQVNMQMEGSNNDALEQGGSSSSDDGQIILALTKMMKKEIEVVVIRTVHQVIGPIVENLIRNVVKEEILSAQEKFLTGGIRNHKDDIILSKERNLQLKFLDELSVPVLTGKEIKGKGGTPMTVALVDKITGGVIDCGPESSAKVEILVLDSSGDVDARNWSREDFNNRIIREGNKKKPHFAKSNYIYLNEGIGSLSNSKLGHDSNWMKSCTCSLGARIVGNFDGIKVQEAWTKSFVVLDSRSKLYENHYPPSLCDQVWRLENIGKDGAPCKRLNENNIFTVKDFLFLHSIDPQRLQKIAAGAKGKATVAKWKATVDHAQTCIIDDKMIYLYCTSSESKRGVTFDVIGGLKGVIHDSRYVPMTNLSEDEKAWAHKLLRSAYENQKDITSFVDEASLLYQYPYRSSDMNGCDLATETIDRYDPTEPGTSCQSITSTVKPLEHSNSFRHFDLLESIVLQQLNNPHLGVSYPGRSCSVSELEPSTSSHSVNTIRNSGSLESITMGQLEDPHLEVAYRGPSCSVSDLEPGTSSHSINTIRHCGSLESVTMGQLNDPHLGVSYLAPSCLVSELEAGISSQSMHTNYLFGSLESITMGQLNDPLPGVLFQGPSFSYSDLEPGNSSKSMNTIHQFGSLESTTMRQLNDSHLEVLYGAPSCSFYDFERYGSERNDIPTTLEAESHPHQQSNVVGIHLIEVVDTMLWMVRARKKFMALRDIRVQKRHRIC
ncbi:hypothetical protein BUALT_Bualt07G0042000 [Buddleja alternifolia]|uniref:Calmodulin-binding protein n=1 Tax=Buddleja alternifolia TaxID=168488 RepID=A0AAV6XG27_9LAMI|nr:hypothetical protein BUALT_Bualt07G0042000 [Buddleja alternifolia]